MIDTITFEFKALNHYNEWAMYDKNIFKRIRELIKDISRNPFEGIGKPEPLRGNLKGYWSRRINDEHRIIYKVKNNELFIAACKGHYELI